MIFWIIQARISNGKYENSLSKFKAEWANFSTGAAANARASECVYLSFPNARVCMQGFWGRVSLPSRSNLWIRSKRIYIEWKYGMAVYCSEGIGECGIIIIMRAKGISGCLLSRSCFDMHRGLSPAGWISRAPDQNNDSLPLLPIQHLDSSSGSSRVEAAAASSSCSIHKHTSTRSISKVCSCIFDLYPPNNNRRIIPLGSSHHSFGSLIVYISMLERIHLKPHQHSSSSS